MSTEAKASIPKIEIHGINDSDHQMENKKTIPSEMPFGSKKGKMMIDDSRETLKLKAPHDSNLKNSIGISSATQIDRSFDGKFVRADRGRRFTVSSTGNRDLNVKINPALFVSRINKRDVTEDFEVGKILGQGAYG